MSEWLVRTAENLIAGPYTSQQVREFIAEEKINRHDEICPANGYWIYLHEGDELWDQLNIRLPRGGDDAEITQTEDISIPELDQAVMDEEDIEERTLLLRNRQIRQFHPRANRAAGSVAARAATPRGRGVTPLSKPVATITPTALRWIVGALTLSLLGIGYLLISRFFFSK